MKVKCKIFLPQFYHETKAWMLHGLLYYFKVHECF